MGPKAVSEGSQTELHLCKKKVFVPCNKRGRALPLLNNISFGVEAVMTTMLKSKLSQFEDPPETHERQGFKGR